MHGIDEPTQHQSYRIDKPTTASPIYSPIDLPVHWTNIVVHCDKQPDKPGKSNCYTHKNTCKLIQDFVLQYY